MTSPEVRRRELLALPLLALEFAGLPLAFLALAVSVESANAAEYERSFNWIQVVPSLIMLASGLWIWRRNRFLPARWAWRGVYFGGIGGFFVCGIAAALSVGLQGWLYDSLIYLFPFLGIIGAAACWALGWAARRVLTYPVDEQLADSRYEWEFGVRDAKRVALVVGTEELHIRESFTVSTGHDSSETRTRGESHHLRAVSVETVHIDGYGGRVQPLLPAQIQTPVGADPGPAVAVHAGQQTLVIPVRDAEQVSGLIQRRIAAARAFAGSR